MGKEKRDLTWYSWLCGEDEPGGKGTLGKLWVQCFQGLIHDKSLCSMLIGEEFIQLGWNNYIHLSAGFSGSIHLEKQHVIMDEPPTLSLCFPEEQLHLSRDSSAGKTERYRYFSCARWKWDTLDWDPKDWIRAEFSSPISPQKNPKTIEPTPINSE